MRKVANEQRQKQVRQTRPISQDQFSLVFCNTVRNHSADAVDSTGSVAATGSLGSIAMFVISL